MDNTASSTHYKPFEQAFSDLEEVAKLLREFEAERDETIKRLTDEWFESEEAKRQLETQIASAFNQERFDACISLLADLERYSELDEVLEQCETFNRFEQHVKIPPKLISDKSLLNFSKFVKSMCYRESIETVNEKVGKELLAEHICQLKNSAEIAAQSEANSKHLCCEYGGSLARSDHERIRSRVEITMSCEVSQSINFHVASHNVQERKKNGITTFLSSMPFLAQSDKSVRESLMSLMLRDEISQEHFEQVLMFVKNELDGSDEGGNSVAVCLQEVSQRVARQLEVLLSSSSLQEDQVDRSYQDSTNRWTVHYSKPTSKEALTSEVRCEAITCIITNHPCVRLKDIRVDYAQSSCIVTRYFAMIYIVDLGIGLVSIHVRHSPHSGQSKQITKQNVEAASSESSFETISLLNEDNVNSTLVSIADRLQELQTYVADAPSDLISNVDEQRKLSQPFLGLKGIVVTGDFNGNIDQWNHRYVSCSSTETGYCLSSAVPEGMTAYGGQSSSAIDGVLFMHLPGDIQVDLRTVTVS